MDPSAYRSLSPELLAEFSAGAGHDLNNPLAAISGRVQIMLREETDPKKQTDLAAILTQVKRAQEMITDLRLTARPPQPQKEQLLLIDLLQKVKKSCDLHLKEQGVEWFTDGPTDIFFHADETQMMVLFRALIRNSLRAMAGAGTIRISWEKGENGLLNIFVSDSGPGIPPEIQPFIFDPYYSSYQSGRGLGFGLTKARIIARMHGGDVTFVENAGKTTFKVTICTSVDE